MLHTRNNILFDLPSIARRIYLLEENHVIYHVEGMAKSDREYDYRDTH